MAQINFSLENIQLEPEDRQYLIESILQDEGERANIAYEYFEDQPEIVFLWLTEDTGWNKEQLEDRYGKENIYNFYNYLNKLYMSDENVPLQPSVKCIRLEGDL